MTGTKIHAEERSVGDIFTDNYRFSIPRYQRPYAWTTEQAGEMLDDLVQAARCEHDLKSSDPYFLGSVVLVKADGDARAEVVDGQQRLTTLIILLSVLREFVPVEYVIALDKQIHQEGNAIRGTVSQPRLTLRDQDQPFLEKYILDRGGLSHLVEIGAAALTDSRRNLTDNALLFQRRLAQLTTEECQRLVSFIDSYTYLVIVATQDFNSAYRIFTVLNERGLDLTHSDILKAEIIGEIPEASQDAYTAIWEREEEELGREKFADLFSHLRMVYAKTKARETILGGFRAAVLSQVPDRREFINKVLVPFSDAFEVITRADYQVGDDTEPINQLLQWLDLLDNTDWIPPAISYLSRHNGDPVAVLAFLADLERLAASMYIRRIDVTGRIDRYGNVLSAIEQGEDLTDVESPLQLGATEKAQTLTALDGDIYNVIRIRRYVLLRLDSALSSGGASYDHPQITVEHVLPQKPPAGSAWRALFTDQQRLEWTHRLANLVLLTGRKNTQASNRSFEAKKNSYFTGPGGVSPFVLTTQVLRQDAWTPDLLRHRQAELLSRLAELWRL